MDPTHRKILNCLQERETANVQEIANYINLARQNLSKKLRELEDDGLIEFKSVGSAKVYSIKKIGIGNFKLLFLYYISF